MKIYSIIHSLGNHIGHFYEYHLAVTSAAKINQWESIKFIPKCCALENLTSDWEKCLIHSTCKEKSKLWFNLLKPFLANIPFFFRFLRNLKKSREPSVLFWEDFSIPYLSSLIVALFWIRVPSLKVWLLHRYDPLDTLFHGKGYLFLHWLLHRLLGEKNFTLLTDGEILAKKQESFFKKPVIVMPIPHTGYLKKTKKKDLDLLSCWWPGGLSRIEKGLHYILDLSNRKNFHQSKINLIVAENVKHLFSLDRRKNIQFILSDLPREEYLRWMHSVDFVLLPYLSENYHSRTSGIFVEAISAGAIPLVQDNTWMAYELKKFNLQELILDWNSPHILENIEALFCNPIQEKVMVMQKAYHKFHCIENFAKTMQKLYSSSL